MLGEGALEGQVVWKRVLAAIEEIRRTDPADGPGGRRTKTLAPLRRGFSLPAPDLEADYRDRHCYQRLQSRFCYQIRYQMGETTYSATFKMTQKYMIYLVFTS